MSQSADTAAEGMIVRRAAERGRTVLDWLDSRHSFSFGHYYDPEHVSFGPLRVINEDRVAAGAGFGAHGHRDMEILTYVLSGGLAHRDSLGNGSVIRPGDVQRMSAGTGIRHSEYNASDTEPVHFLQIWIEPNARGIKPGYEEKHFPEAERRGRLRIIAARDGRGGALSLHQDADVYAALLDRNDRVTHHPAGTRQIWVQVARGGVDVNGVALEAGDGAGLVRPDLVEITGTTAQTAELLLFPSVLTSLTHTSETP